MKNKDFVTYEQAVALKKLGFREKCLCHYTFGEFVINNYVVNEEKDEYVYVDNLLDSLNTDTLGDNICDAPTLSQVQTWLRKEKRYSVEELYDCDDKWSYFIVKMSDGEYIKHISDFNSPEEALSAGISEAIKFLEFK